MILAARTSAACPCLFVVRRDDPEPSLIACWRRWRRLSSLPEQPLFEFEGTKPAGNASSGTQAAIAVSAHGTLLACAASASFVAYVFSANWAARHPHSMPPLLTAAAVNAGQAMVMGVLLAGTHSLSPAGARVRLWMTSGALSADGVLGTALSWRLPAAHDHGAVAHLAGAVAAYVVAQGALFVAFAAAERASAVTIFLNVEPLLTVVLGVAVLSEPFGWLQWLGLLTAVGALCLSSALAVREAPAVAVDDARAHIPRPVKV